MAELKKSKVEMTPVTIVSGLILTLKEDHKPTEGEHFPAGMEFFVIYISEQEENKHFMHLSPKDMSCQIYVPSQIPWKKLKFPKVCTLIRSKWGFDHGRKGIYGEGCSMGAIYCATHGKFVGIELDRTDVISCPLCRSSF